MSGTVDIKRVLLAVMAAATLAVVLAVPHQAWAASDCAAAGTDPTAAQYCPPTEPKEEECVEGGSGSNPANSGSGSKECTETSATPPSAPPTGGAAASEGGTLPFTGIDVIALLAIATAFIAVGLALQRLSKADVERS